mmetsp:Transcript_52638/g.132286  ORF Transcript_52638/g.132286 Transcript_52638/m.132286 type:complete len:340 (-) Transcript_52638:85-1104(-)
MWPFLCCESSCCAEFMRDEASTQIVTGVEDPKIHEGGREQIAVGADTKLSQYKDTTTANNALNSNNVNVPNTANLQDLNSQHQPPPDTRIPLLGSPPPSDRGVPTGAPPYAINTAALPQTQMPQVHKPASTHGPEPGVSDGGAAVSGIGASVGGGAAAARSGGMAGGTNGDAKVVDRAKLTAEAKQREKEKLQEMVKEFAKSVMGGMSCEYVDNHTLKLKPATYTIDRALRLFSVQTKDAPADADPLVAFEITKMVEIHRHYKKMPPLMSLPDPTTAMSSNDLARLICIQYTHDDRPMYMLLCLRDPADQERFFTCMKILRWAMEGRQTNEPKRTPSDR